MWHCGGWSGIRGGKTSRIPPKKSIDIMRRSGRIRWSGGFYSDPLCCARQIPVKSSGKIRIEVKNTINGRWMPHATYRDDESGGREAKAELDRLSSAGYAVRAMASGGDYGGGGMGCCGDFGGMAGFRTQPDIHPFRWPSSRIPILPAGRSKRRRTWLPITL